MKVQVISFHCHLKNSLGQTISQSTNKDVITTSENSSALLSGLAEKLIDIKKGEKRWISLPASEAYGYFDPNKIILYPRKKLPERIAVNNSVTIVGKSGQPRTYKIVNIQDDMVGLDGNHPLAGQDLIFEIEALDARAATEEEIHDSFNPLSKQLLH